MHENLQKLLKNNPLLWRADDGLTEKKESFSTGYVALDGILPASGWPANALVELIVPRWGIGELQLVSPVMAQLSQSAHYLVWIAPPFIPYAPSLQTHGIVLERLFVLPKTQVKEGVLWSMEKVLRAHSCGVAMAWPQRVTDKTARRLQLAAENGRSLGFIFRNVEAKSSPAALRMRLTPVKNGLEVQVLKARGTSRFQRVCLNINVGEN